MKFDGKFLQTKLLSRLSHKVCRLVSSPVLLRNYKFTNSELSHFLPRLERPLPTWNVPFEVSPELPCFSYTDRMSALGGLRNVTCSYNCWSNEPKF